MKHYPFKFEKNLQRKGYEIIIGIDEAGRGPLAGPVAAAAVALRKIQIPSNKSQTNSKSQIQNLKQYRLIRDSKLLSEKQREALYDFICENFHVGIGICDHKTIDRINILQATYLAMKKAIASLTRSMKHEVRIKNRKTIILVDGNKIVPNCSYEQRAIIGGDKLVKSISVASIIAKVTRDRIMRQMHKIYPDYCFDRHKGYGTALHYKQLKKHGPCEIHRKSFNLVLSIK
jgi:ribonuclease HII